MIYVVVSSRPLTSSLSKRASGGRSSFITFSGESPYKCDKCDLSVHQVNCSKLSASQYEALSMPNSDSWFCSIGLSSTLPFHVDTSNPEASGDIPSCSIISADFKSFFSTLKTTKYS